MFSRFEKCSGWVSALPAPQALEGLAAAEPANSLVEEPFAVWDVLEVGVGKLEDEFVVVIVALKEDGLCWPLVEWLCGSEGK